MMEAETDTWQQVRDIHKALTEFVLVPYGNGECKGIYVFGYCACLVLTDEEYLDVYCAYSGPCEEEDDLHRLVLQFNGLLNEVESARVQERDVDQRWHELIAEFEAAIKEASEKTVG